MTGQAALRVQEVNPAKLALLYRRQFELCKVKQGETIAVLGAGSWGTALAVHLARTGQRAILAKVFSRCAGRRIAFSTEGLACWKGMSR
mgnify:CR=1 FL=1